MSGVARGGHDEFCFGRVLALLLGFCRTCGGGRESGREGLVGVGQGCCGGEGDEGGDCEGDLGEERMCVLRID